METTFTHKIYSKTDELPINWDVLSMHNIFLSKDYLKVLELSAPDNMTCHFIGFFQNEELIGIAVSQFLDANKLKSFGERDKCIKTSVRNFIFKNFSSHVLFIGNNMLTGQNAFSFSKEIDAKSAVNLLIKASEELKKIFKSKGIKVHITTFKDFEEKEIIEFEKSGFHTHYKFSIQPNMIFSIPENWKTEQDYVEALSKKYRDQYKRARKKSQEIEKRKLHLEDIVKYEDTIYDLYFHVAKNAPFNTFFLAKNHFRVFKEILKDKFLFYGYFIDNKLIGFNTLVINSKAIDTYFLGYNDTIQKEKLLYLNMLYDMIGYSIKKGFKEIIFARTALEIKSSIGAKPSKMHGFIKHEARLLHHFMEIAFNYLEPKTEWKERNPFK